MDISEIRRRLQFDGEFYWVTQLDVPCWGVSVPIWVDADEDGLTDEQLRVVSEVLSYNGPLRMEFETKVFAWYCDHIYGGSWITDEYGNDVTDQYIPKLKDSAQIWPLIEKLLYLNVPRLSDGDDSIQFNLGMECRWDSEHGLGVAFRNWQVHEIGGEGDV